MKLMYRLITSLLILTITACATPITKEQLNNIKTVGLINSFPENPNYLSIGLTIFENETSNLDALSFKQYLTDISSSYLKKQGLNVSTFRDRESAEKANLDMVIELLPRDAYQKPGTYGYGFYQRTLFGAKVGNAQSYVALNLSPESRYFSSAFSAYYKENFDNIHLKALPENWDKIPEADRSKMIDNLKNNIDKTVIGLFKEFGL